MGPLWDLAVAVVSASEHEQQVEARSSIKVTMNAKRDAQWEVKVVDGAEMADLDELRKIAVAQHNALIAELIGSVRV